MSDDTLTFNADVKVADEWEQEVLETVQNVLGVGTEKVIVTGVS